MGKRRIARKPHYIKKKKPFFCFLSFWLGLSGCVLFAAGFYFLFFSPIFQFQEVIVSGGEEKVAEKIRLEAGDHLERKLLFFKTRSIWTANVKRLKTDALEKFPQIASVETKRNFPNLLNVKITEKVPVAAWCSQDSCFFMDDEGVIFLRDGYVQDGLLEIAKENNAGFFAPGERVIKAEELNQILKIKADMEKNSDDFLKLKEIFIDGERSWIVETNEGWKAYFNPQKNLDWQLAKLKVVLEKKIPGAERKTLEYIDLRFEKVYYK